MQPSLKYAMRLMELSQISQSNISITYLRFTDTVARHQYIVYSTNILTHTYIGGDVYVDPQRRGL